MADTLTTQSATLATIPASSVIATDDAGASGHVQIVKLALSTDGSATPITADSNGLEVQGAGTAGTPAGGVVSVQGVASGTVLPVSDGGASLTVDGTVSVTGVSTLAEQQSQTTHLATIADDTTDIETAVELIDDTVATLGTTTYSEATTKGLIVGAIRRDADTTLVDTTNEVAPLQVDANGRLKVEAFSGETLPVSLSSTTITGTVAVTQSGTWDEVGINDSGNSITVDDGGTSLTVDGTVSVSGTVTVDGSGVTQPVSHAALTELAAAIDTEVQVDVVGALPAGNNNIGNIDVETFPSTVHSADYDTGGGTDTTLAFGIAVPASGGAAVIPGDATAGLKVDLGADNDVTVTGSVTANAGTNLNTSALALESGGNLAGAATSLAVIDDWDESDRAKVNPIVGQAGVQGGSGTVSNTTQRVVLATDVGLPAGTSALGKVGHDHTGMGHGVTTVTTAGTDVALAASTACKRVIIQAQTDNTSLIAVGATGVDATVATGTGILLYPGDAIQLDIDNLADIFIDSLVNGEGVRYTYFT